MDNQMLEKLEGICNLCRKSGADDSQYILVPIGVLEELIEAWKEENSEEAEH